LIVAKFFEKYNKTLRDTIVSEFVGRSENTYLLAHDFCIDPANACANIFRSAIKGLGTRDSSLINITVLFRDRYAAGVSDFYKPYGNLVKDIKGDTSGWYEKTLLQLWGLQWFMVIY